MVHLILDLRKSKANLNVAKKKQRTDFTSFHGANMYWQCYYDGCLMLLPHKYKHYTFKAIFKVSLSSPNIKKAERDETFLMPG